MDCIVTSHVKKVTLDKAAKRSVIAKTMASVILSLVNSCIFSLTHSLAHLI